MKCNLCDHVLIYCVCGGEYEDDEAESLRAERDAARERVRALEEAGREAIAYILASETFEAGIIEDDNAWREDGGITLTEAQAREWGDIGWKRLDVKIRLAAQMEGGEG